MCIGIIHWYKIIYVIFYTQRNSDSSPQDLQTSDPLYSFFTSSSYHRPATYVFIPCGSKVCGGQFNSCSIFLSLLGCMLLSYCPFLLMRKSRWTTLSHWYIFMKVENSLFVSLVSLGYYYSFFQGIMTSCKHNQEKRETECVSLIPGLTTGLLPPQRTTKRHMVERIQRLGFSWVISSSIASSSSPPRFSFWERRTNRR